MSDETTSGSDTYFPPPESGGGWRKNTGPGFLRELGMDPVLIERLLEYNVGIPSARWEPYCRYQACLVIKNGWIVGEAYNCPETREFKQYLASNGKAFAMALFGTLSQESREGKPRYRVSLDSPLYDQRWLPDGFPLSDPLKASITFEQVFTHSAGILPEDRERERNNPQVKDFVAYTVGHDRRFGEAERLYYPPGHPEDYDGASYSSVAFNHLAMVFRHLTDLPAHRVLEERVLHPIGIESTDYHAYAGWDPPCPGNRWAPCGGLRLTPRDYARFAYLLLKEGTWANRRIVPRAYLRRFTTSTDAPNILSNAGGTFGAEYPADLFRIAGSGLSMAFMVPSHDLIFLRTSRAPNSLWQTVVDTSLDLLFGALGQTR